MNYWNIAAAVLGAVIAYTFYVIGFRKGFRAGEKQGAETVVAHVIGLKGQNVKDEGPARHYHELEEHRQTGGVVRNLKDYGHGN